MPNHRPKIRRKLLAALIANSLLGGQAAGGPWVFSLNTGN